MAVAGAVSPQLSLTSRSVADGFVCVHQQHGQHCSLASAAELDQGAVDLDLKGAEHSKAHHGHPADAITVCAGHTPICRTLSRRCSRLAAGISLAAARAHDGVLAGRTQRPEQKELDVFRIPLMLGVFVALSCAGISTAADGPADRPDGGRHLPDGADIQSTTTAPRPDDRGDRFTPGASPEPVETTGRPDGRTVPDAVDARNSVTPAIIREGESGTTSFDWLAALIGGLTVGGVALATGGSARSPPPRTNPRSLTRPPPLLPRGPSDRTALVVPIPEQRVALPD